MSWFRTGFEMQHTDCECKRPRSEIAKDGVNELWLFWGSAPTIVKQSEPWSLPVSSTRMNRSRGGK